MNLTNNFQSYLSPIQTDCPPFADTEINETFNPTLVQFKPPEQMPNRLQAAGFQSYLSPIQTL